jgi:hypothetical protein
LYVEHVVLRVMMEALGRWLEAGISVEVLRARAVLLGLALEDHAQREEKFLFEVMRPLTSAAEWPVDMMMLAHAELRSLFAEMADPRVDPINRLRTTLRLIEGHFAEEENSLFPMVEFLIGPHTLARLGTEPEHSLMV